MTTNANRIPIHAYLEPDTHTAWHSTAAKHRLSVAALLEALGPNVDAILRDRPHLVEIAGRVDARRRARR